MTHDPHAILKLAQKLIEVFSDRNRRGFDRYWALQGPVAAFAEGAVGEAEEQLAEMLLMALEEALVRTAPKSVHPDALAMVARLGLPRYRR